MTTVSATSHSAVRSTTLKRLLPGNSSLLAQVQPQFAGHLRSRRNDLLRPTVRGNPDGQEQRDEETARRWNHSRPH